MEYRDCDFAMIGVVVETALRLPIIIFDGERRHSAKQDSRDCPAELLVRISPVGWALILLKGEYRWLKRRPSWKRLNLKKRGLNKKIFSENNLETIGDKMKKYTNQKFSRFALMIITAIYIFSPIMGYSERNNTIEIKPLISIEDPNFRDLVFSSLVFINLSGVGVTEIDEEGKRNYIFLSGRNVIQNGRISLGSFPSLTPSVLNEIAKISSTSDTCAIQPFGNPDRISSIVAISSYDKEFSEKDVKCFLYSLSFLFGFQNEFSGNENISEMSKMFINR